MATRSKPQIDALRTQTFVHEIPRDGFPYEFRLSHRPIEFGPKYLIDYHWIDLRSLRLPKKFRDRRAPLFDNMLSFWLSGLLDAPQVSDDDLRDLLLAACFPGFSIGRAIQSVYLDAHLNNERSKSAFNSVDDSARMHIKHVIDSRNQWLLRQEMFRLLGGNPCWPKRTEQL